uniref:APC membrane recruitment protein 2 n=1 Tax=Oryzias melastigma TaxID=30732 RepID=A0A3B3DLR1_ORYME
MEVQTECVEPPVAPQCDPQPTGRINKAAFKLFGKRRTGSGMASFFSFRNKGATGMELVRSKTHDGLTGSNDTDGQKGEAPAGLEAGPVRSLSKSLSFFSFLRRSSFRSGENGGVGIVRRGRGLKGFFSSMRWRRKEKTSEGETEEVDGKNEKVGGIVELEKVKNITLTLEPPPHHHQQDCENAEEKPSLQAADTPTSSVVTPLHCEAMPGPSGAPDSPFAYTPTDSPLRAPVQKAKASISSLTPSLATPPLDRCSAGDPPSEPSVDRLCSLLFTDVTSLKSFDSLTGCGDIIADAEEEGTAPPPPQQHPAGSGVVAYMGGGEEMASPEGVDDADMQGLWHMLPSAGDDSPALPRVHQPLSTNPTSTCSSRTNPLLPSGPRCTDRKAPQVKTLGLSKIPVVGAVGNRSAKPPMPYTHGRHPTSPGEKELLSDEGYWDTPSATPTATPDESGLQRNQKITLSRDSCSGDHLYDLYTDPEEERRGDEDLISTPSPSTEHKTSPSSQTSPPSSSSSSSFRSMKGSTSLPRESKIPVSTKPTSPPHSVSQPQANPPARTRIPVSKVPVRRSGNKTDTTGGNARKK